MDQSALESRLLNAWNPEDSTTLPIAFNAIKAEGDADAVRFAAFFLLDRMRQENRVLEEIEWIKSWLFDHTFEDMRTLLQLTDRWIQTTLKIEDFDEMDEALRYRERFLGTFPKEATMQSFYKAVSLEGKKQYRAALDALEGIPDTLSGAKLASKYLKKAMLQLRIDDLRGANESYQRALLFDPHRQNEIAVLVKADLLAHEGQYVEALETFESFFVKTNQKLRYLDRYIDWCVTLSRYEDASRFIENYLPKMMASQSKNYRVQFFEAVKRFADIIHHETWQTIAARAIRSAEQPLSRDEDCLVELESQLRQDAEAFDEHESIRQLCMILARHHNFERLHWIRIEEDQIVLWRFQKNRLYEETVKDASFLLHLMEQDAFEQVFFPEELNNRIDYMTSRPFPSEQIGVLFVKRRRDPSGLTLMLIAGTAESKATLSLHRALSLSFSIAATNSLHAHQLRLTNRQLERKNTWMDNRKIAWTTVKNGFLLLENETAMRLFETDAPMLLFEAAFSRVRAQKPLFPDDFLRQSEWFVEVLEQDNTGANYRIDAQIETDCVRLAWTPVDLPKPTQSVLPRSSAEEAIRSNGDHAAFGWLRFRGGDPFEFATVHTREHVATILEASLFSAAGSLLVWHRFETDRTGWWVIQTIDKRVVSRIARQTNDIFRDRLLQECSIGWDGTLLFSCAFVRFERPLDAIKEALDLCSLDVSNDETVAFADKKTWEQIERSHAMHVRLEEWMKSDRIPLFYKLYANQTTQTYAFAMIVSMDTLDDDERLFRWTVDRHRLVQEHTQAVWKKAMKEIERFYRETKRRIPFAIVVDESFLTIPASARLMTLEAKRRKLPLDMLNVFVRVHGPTISRALLAEMEYLDTKGFHVGVYSNNQRILPVVAALTPQWPFFTDSMMTLSFLQNRSIVAGQSNAPYASIVPTDLPYLSLNELIHKWPAQVSGVIHPDNLS